MKTIKKITAIFIIAFISMAFSTTIVKEKPSNELTTLYYYSSALTYKGGIAFTFSSVGSTTCNNTSPINEVWRKAFEANGFQTNSTDFPTHIFNSMEKAKNHRDAILNKLKKGNSPISYIDAFEHNCD
jgi:hypothetical protein